MTDGLLALQAAADTATGYRDFPVIGSRAAIWIAAEIHLMFAAFVLGVPIFAVVAEAIGIFGKDQRYDRLAKEFTRLLLIAYSATAIWGAVLVGLGILLNIWGTTVMFIADSWLTYMMTPPRDITPETSPTSIKLWHAILNHTW